MALYLRLKEPLQVGQTLTLKTVGTKEEIACTEVDIDSRDRETPEMALSSQILVFGSGVFPFHRKLESQMPRCQPSGSGESRSFSSKCGSAFGKEIVKTKKHIHLIDGSGVGFLLSLGRCMRLGQDCSANFF